MAPHSSRPSVTAVTRDRGDETESLLAHDALHVQGQIHATNLAPVTNGHNRERRVVLSAPAVSYGGRPGGYCGSMHAAEHPNPGLGRTVDRTRRAPRPLRGRVAERARLDACCAAVADGSEAHIILIEGDAGIGKTRLLAELRTIGRLYNVAVAFAGCDAIASDRPFGPLLEALRIERTSSDDRRRRIAERVADLASFAPVGQLGPTAGGLELGARYGIQDEIVELLLDEADERPLVLALDDAQWVDVATASTIGALVRRKGHRPIALVVAARPDPRPPALVSLVQRWHEELEIVRLSPLSASVACEVAEDVLGSAPPANLVGVLKRAGGNAFSVVALARGFVAEDTTSLEGVRASVLSRVHRLGDDAAAVLATAAILGVDFTPETVAILGQRSPFEMFDLLHGATRAGLLVSRGPAFGFSHDLIADQLVAEVPEALRAAIHRSIVHHAAALGLSAPTIAHHVMAASMPDDLAAIDLLCRAALEVTRHDPESALAYLDHAAILCGPQGDRQTDVALRRSSALCTLRRVTAARQVLDDALVSERVPDRIAALRSGRARCAHLLGDLASAANDLELLARSGILEPAAEAAAWADVATYRFWMLQGDQPSQEAGRAVALADSCGAIAPAVQAIAVQATMASFAGDVFRGVELARQASARGMLLPHDQVIPSPGFTEGLTRMLADDFAAAIAILQLDRLRIERLGDPLLAARPATALVIVQYLAGQWDEALADAVAVAAVCAETGSAIGQLVAPVISGLIAHHRGDDAAAEQWLAEASTTDGAAEGYAVPFLLHLQALRLEAAGHREAALSLLADTVGVAQSLAPAIGTWFAVDAARLLLDGVSSPPAFDVVMSGLEETAARIGLPGAKAFAAIMAGAMEGDHDKVTDAIEGARGSPNLLARFGSLEIAGIALHRNGSHETALALLREATNGYEMLNAPMLARRSALIDSSLGGPVRQLRKTRPRFGWDSLTKAEHAVLELVTQAQRNGDIADVLVLSKRTVESHIASILLKLGVRSRVELVLAAQQQAGY